MADKSLVQVATAVTSNSQTSTLNWPGGTGQMVIGGTFDTATVKLQVSPDGGSTWIDVGGDASVTAAAVVNFTLNSCEIRLDISSVDSSTSINGWLTRTTGLWA